MITFDLRGIERAVRGIRRFQEDAKLVGPDEVVEQIVEFAASGRNPDGSAWAKLTPGYANWKKKRGLPPVANKRVTGKLLMSVKNRDMVVAPDSEHLKIAEGLEKKRKSFAVAPIAPGNVERKLLRLWNRNVS